MISRRDLRSRITVQKRIGPEPIGTERFREKTSDTKVMTLKQAANYLRISKAHLSNVINHKVANVPALRHAQIGRRILIKREWADEWLEIAGQESLQ